MKILHCSPVFSVPWYDCGWFFIKAFMQLGHHITIWDYRLDLFPQTDEYDLAFVYKGNRDTLTLLPHGPKICYYPDDMSREPGIEHVLSGYKHVLTTVRPTPKNQEWFPTGYDPDLHKPLSTEKNINSIFVGTHTLYKAQFLNVIRPDCIFGNGWTEGMNTPVKNFPAIYLHEYVRALSLARVAVNMHRDFLGLNSRLFEMCACTFTLTDIVPGVEEVLGKELCSKVGFSTPEEGREKVEYYLARPQEREELWQAERKAILPYTYLECAKRVIACAS